MAEHENGAGVSATELTADEALAQFEAQKMSRRAVLAKFGLKFGAAALMALSVDDLARKATAELAARNKTNKAIQEVAAQFKNAGIASAKGLVLPCPYTDCVTCSLYSWLFACRDAGSRVACCDNLCVSCCTPSEANSLPCGNHPDAVVAACTQKCQGYNGGT